MKELRTKLDVTAKEISEGRPGDPESCPIALTIRRTLLAKNIHVGMTKASYTVGTYRYHAVLPFKAQDFIDAFDLFKLKAQKPISFFLHGKTKR